MEGSSAPTWVPFTSWLEQQRGEHPSTAPSSEREGAAESSSEGPSSRGSSDSETSFRADDVERASGRRYVTESSSNRQPQRHPVSASLARDCRMETRLVDGCGRARQEMTIMLAAPGTPLHKSPFVTAKQAGSLLAALYDPLVQVSVGRLTRRLEDPSMLRPTQDRGTLGLWLLPNDDLSLVWQGRTASADETAQTAARVHPSLALRSGNRCTTSDAMAEVVVWEELARFPASRHTSHDEPLITIHMLRGDRSGRSFYIKPRADVGCGPGVAPVLDTAAGGDGAAGRAKRMYFWLTEGDIGTAIHSLGRLKSLVKNPPSLAKRSGVPEAQLREIGAWIHAQAQPHAQQALRQQQHTSSAASASPSAASPSGFGPGSALTGLAQGTASMGEVLSRQAPASNCRTFSLADGRLAATSTVSATATALYRDRRLSMACPCNISVGATVLLKGTPVGGTAVEEATADLLMAATARAKVVAEECARKTVDRLGRQRVEELVCESLVEGVRSQRALAKADRAQRREQQRRQRAAAESQALIKKAVEHAALCTGSPSRRNKALPGEQLAAEAEWEAGSTGSGSAFGEATTSSSEEAIMHSPDSPVAPHRHIAPSTQHGHGVAPPPGAGRVTVDNLHTLLNAASLEAREQPADAPSTARSVSGKISIADLGDLLRPRPSPQ